MDAAAIETRLPVLADSSSQVLCEELVGKRRVPHEEAIACQRGRLWGAWDAVRMLVGASWSWRHAIGSLIVIGQHQRSGVPASSQNHQQPNRNRPIQFVNSHQLIRKCLAPFQKCRPHIQDADQGRWIPEKLTAVAKSPILMLVVR